VRRRLGLVAAALLGLLLLAQAVPYGRAHGQRRPTRSARFDGAATRALVADACADCHSYDTKWRWYSDRRRLADGLRRSYAADPPGGR
jgi:Haem-binding domain